MSDDYERTAPRIDPSLGETGAREAPMTGGDTAYGGVGYPTPTTTSSPGTGPGATGYGSTGESSTTDVVKVQASQVGQEAVAGGQHVAGVAAEQTKNVASEAGAQAQNLLSEARSQLSDQAAAQQNNLASWLPDLATELGSMVDRSDASDAPSGTATGLARQASGRAHSVAGWLADHEPADVLGEVSRFARQRPGMFLALAAVGGLLAGRLTRGLTSDPDSDPGTSTTSTTSSTSTTATTTLSAAPVGDRYTAPPVTPSVSSPAEGTPTAASTDEYWAADEHLAGDVSVPRADEFDPADDLSQPYHEDRR